MRYAAGIIFIFVLAVIFPTLVLSNWLFWSVAEVVEPMAAFVFVMVAVGVIIMTGEFKTYVKAMNALLSKKYFIDARDKERAVNLFKLLAKAMIGTAVFMFMQSIIIMLTQLDDLSAIGPNLAVALISAYYAAIINIVLIYPAIHVLQNRPDPQPVSVVISEKQVIDKLLELCYKQGISPEDILAANEISFGKDE